jgi:GNAT superfamily N-acetyltransferase
MGPNLQTGDPINTRAIARCLARAFNADPLIGFLIPDAADAKRRRIRYFEMMVESRDMIGGCDTVFNTRAAVLWRWPQQNKWDVPFDQVHREAEALKETFGADLLARNLDILGELESHHPVDPHVYLSAIGTEPDYRSRGFGTRLVENGLAKADAAGLGVYLEASTPRSARFFTRFGFEAAPALNLSNGLSVTPMWRDANSARPDLGKSKGPAARDLNAEAHGGKTDRIQPHGDSPRE